MSIDALDVLRGTVPFSRLDDDELEKLIVHLDELTVEDGKHVFKEGDDSNAMFVIIAGAIDVIKGGDPIAELPTGTVVGEIGLLTAHHSRSATARARGKTILMRWASADFRRRLEDNDPIVHKVALDLAHQLAERLKRMTDEFMKLQERFRAKTPKKVASEFEDFKNRMLDEVFFSEG